MEGWASQLKSISNKVKQMALNLTDTEMKVEEATNSEPWGPHGSLMSEIAQMSYDPEKYKEIMQVLARRLTDEEEWRHVYKGLLLLEFLAKHGPMKVVHELQGNMSFLDQLKDYKFVDKAGKDCGLNVRNRAKELASLTADQQRILEEREKAQKNKSKYGGVGREEATRFGGFGPSKFGTGGFGGGGGFGSTYDSDAGFRASAPSSGGKASAAAEDDDEDPFEATKKRIDRLKANGGIGEEAEGRPRVPPSAAQPATSEPEKRKGPKTLSDVKVNPDIAKAFLKGGPAGGAAKPRDLGDLLGGAPAAGSTNGGASAMDQLAGLHVGAPASGVDLLAGPVPQQGGGGQEAWDAFGNNGGAAGGQDPFLAMSAPAVQPAAAPQPVDDFADFASAPPKAPADPFAALGGAAPAAQTAAFGKGVGGAGGAPKAALPADMFLDAPAVPLGMPQAMTGGMQPGGSVAKGGMAAMGVTPGMAGFQQPASAAGGATMPTLNAGMGMGMSQGPAPTGGYQGLVQPGLGAGPMQLKQTSTGMPSMTIGAVPMLASAAPAVKSGFTNALVDSGAPMRPGAARPVSTTKKDPFADLGAL